MNAWKALYETAASILQLDVRDGAPMLTVVSRSFPPQVSGSAIVLANLLSNYPGDIRAIAGYNRYSKSDPTFLSPCPSRYMVLPRIFPRVYDGLSTRLPAIMCRSIVGSIKRALINLGTNVVLAAFPAEDFLMATFLAARQLRLPFYVHMHDLWLENMPAGTAAVRFAEKWEPVVLKEATRVLCMTEAMQRHYEKKYAIRTELLPHCVPDRDYFDAPGGIRPPRMSKPTALFVGGISEAMNLDALKVLASASELLPSEYELMYCTSWDLATLNRSGIQSSRLRVKYVSRSEVQRLQSEAHILLAPLSHKNCSMEEVRTVFSTKLLEYFVSGRPIIVFAPEGSYHVESARKNGWGYVVTEDSPLALAAAIVRVTTDETLAARLVRAALREAQSRSASYHAKRLREWVLADTRQPASPRA
jgi:glycosyltransferase involved in cell wall biosynthesis